MGLRYGQGKYGTFKYGPAEQGFQFRCVVSDENGNVVLLINNQVKELSWAYKRVGGCGKFKMTLKRQYDDLTNLTAANRRAMYDLQIYITGGISGTSTLFYRGYITSIRPNLQDAEETVVSGIGYGERLSEIQVHDGTGAPKEYTGSTISGVVTSLFNDFIDDNTDITVGTIDTFSTAIDSIKFNGSVEEALNKLASFVDAEWGVDRNMELYFLQKSETIAHRFKIGLDIGSMEDELDYSEIVNVVYIEGGDIDDGTGTGDTVPFRYVATNDASIAHYGRKEKRISNSSVVDATVAAKLASSILERYQSYQRNTRISLPFNKDLLEETIPLGNIGIVNVPKQRTKKYSQFKYGGRAGVDGWVYCGEPRYKIASISYELKDLSVSADVELNEGKPDVTAQFELLEFQLEQQRQAQGV